MRKTEASLLIPDVNGILVKYCFMINKLFSEISILFSWGDPTNILAKLTSAGNKSRTHFEYAPL